MKTSDDENLLTRADLMRTVIMGNTATGKSWLAERLGHELRCRVVSLDDIRWIGTDFSEKQLASVAIDQTCECAKETNWIIEGVYGWLILPIIHRATCLIWTDIAWEESRRNLWSREKARGSNGNFEELETWSKDYWTRDGQSSYKTHAAIFDAFLGAKFRLETMADTSSFISKLRD